MTSHKLADFCNFCKFNQSVDFFEYIPISEVLYNSTYTECKYSVIEMHSKHSKHVVNVLWPDCFTLQIWSWPDFFMLEVSKNDYTNLSRIWTWAFICFVFLSGQTVFAPKHLFLKIRWSVYLLYIVTLLG